MLSARKYHGSSNETSGSSTGFRLIPAVLTRRPQHVHPNSRFNNQPVNTLPGGQFSLTLVPVQTAKPVPFRQNDP
jgi:hypothetical protein